MEMEQTSQPPFTKEYLHSVYSYKDGELFFKDGKRAHASSENKKWYLKMTIEGVRYGVHRVILFYHTGEWGDTGHPVDHIDGNIQNNRIENLQLIKNSSNIRKGKIRKNNTTGVAGVTWSKAAKKYMAQIRDNREYIYLGLFDSIEEAEKVVLKTKENIEQRKYGQTNSKTD